MEVGGSAAFGCPGRALAGVGRDACLAVRQATFGTVSDHASECKQLSKYLVNFFFFKLIVQRIFNPLRHTKTRARVMVLSVTISHEVHYKGNVGSGRDGCRMYIFIIKNVKPFILRSQNNH